MLTKAYDARRIQPDALIGEVLGKSVPALQGVMMGDGALSSWQGGLPLAKADMDAVILGSGVRARAMRQARDWGYQRISAGSTVLLADAAPLVVITILMGVYPKPVLDVTTPAVAKLIQDNKAALAAEHTNKVASVEKGAAQ